MRNRLIISAAALMLMPFATWSGGLDEDEGVRDNFTLVPDGQLLITPSPTDDAAGLVRRSAAGVDSTIVTDGQSLGSGFLDGIGAQPHMNASGVAAFQVQFLASDVTTGIFTGTPGGVTEIAATTDTVAGEVICNIEPYPQINASNQVFWGTTLFDSGNCPAGGDNGRKGIFRFTPPSTNILLLLADNSGSGSPDTLTTSDSNFVSGSTTFTIVDAHLIAHGGDAITSSGNALVTAWFAEPPPPKPKGLADSKGLSKDRQGLLYLTPGGFSLVALDDGDTTPLSGGSIFGQIGKGVANASGLVFFKAQVSEATGAAGSLSLWTSGGGLSELVAQGDGLPIGPGTFEGFSPFMDLNNGGSAAFTARLDINASCDAAQDLPNCRGVYYSPDGSSIVEVARTTIAVAAGGVGMNFAEGFEFEGLSSVAVMAENGTVFFVAENLNSDPVCGAPDSDFGDGQIAGIMAWIPGSVAPVKMIAEGDLLPEGQVMRLFLPMPELRQHDGPDDTFVVRAWFDTTGNCTPDFEEIILASLIPFEHPSIPALGPWGLWLLIGVLGILGGARLLPRRN